MKTFKETVQLHSLGDELKGVLFLPAATARSPVLIICHGAGEFKENYFELCELLAGRGVATLAIDMHGHGESAGERYYVNMRQWVADVQAAIDYLLTNPKIDGKSEEHTSELQSPCNLVCRLLLEKKKKKSKKIPSVHIQL